MTMNWVSTYFVDCAWSRTVAGSYSEEAPWAFCCLPLSTPAFLSCSSFYSVLLVLSCLGFPKNRLLPPSLYHLLKYCINKCAALKIKVLITGDLDLIGILVIVKIGPRWFLNVVVHRQLFWLSNKNSKHFYIKHQLQLESTNTCQNIVFNI